LEVENFLPRTKWSLSIAILERSNRGILVFGWRSVSLEERLLGSWGVLALWNKGLVVTLPQGSLLLTIKSSYVSHLTIPGGKLN
jgi:hypothetical protein